MFKLESHLHVPWEINLLPCAHADVIYILLFLVTEHMQPYTHIGNCRTDVF